MQGETTKANEVPREVAMNRAYMRLTDKLPDEADKYHFWWFWLLVAGMKAIAYANYRVAKRWYWNKDTLLRGRKSKCNNL